MRCQVVSGASFLVMVRDLTTLVNSVHPIRSFVIIGYIMLFFFLILE